MKELENDKILHDYKHLKEYFKPENKIFTKLSYSWNLGPDTEFHDDTLS